MLFNGGDALKRIIDFFLEAGDVLYLFFEIVEITTDRFEFRADGSKFVAHDGANVILCCHVVDDVREHVAEFFERRFLSCHMPEYSTPVGLGRRTPVFAIGVSGREASDTQKSGSGLSLIVPLGMALAAICLN